MSFVKYISALPLALSLMGAAQAKSMTHHTQVPFTQVTLSEADKTAIDYNFGAHQTISCKEANNSPAASIEWKYNGVTYKKMLPVTLRDDNRYKGEWADSGDHFWISNDYGHEDLFVTCEYRNMD